MTERIQKLERFLELDTNDNFVKHALALEYQKMGDDTKAKNLFVDILTKTPEYVGSYYHLGKLLERNGKIDDAKDWYLKGMDEAKKQNDRHAFNELQSAWEELEY